MIKLYHSLSYSCTFLTVFIIKKRISENEEAANACGIAASYSMSFKTEEITNKSPAIYNTTVCNLACYT